MHPQALQSVALAVAEGRSVEPVLSRIVLGLLAQEGVALAPLNVRKVGRVGGSGEPILASTHLAESPWIARPDWVRRERVVSFAAQPLIFRGAILEVLAVFSRAETQEAQFEWLGPSPTTPPWPSPGGGTPTPGALPQDRVSSA